MANIILEEGILTYLKDTKFEDPRMLYAYEREYIIDLVERDIELKETIS